MSFAACLTSEGFVVFREGDAIDYSLLGGTTAPKLQRLLQSRLPLPEGDVRQRVLNSRAFHHRDDDDNAATANGPVAPIRNPNLPRFREKDVPEVRTVLLKAVIACGLTPQSVAVIDARRGAEIDGGPDLVPEHQFWKLYLKAQFPTADFARLQRRETAQHALQLERGRAKAAEAEIRHSANSNTGVGGAVRLLRAKKSLAQHAAKARQLEAELRQLGGAVEDCDDAPDGGGSAHNSYPPAQASSSSASSSQHLLTGAIRARPSGAPAGAGPAAFPLPPVPLGQQQQPQFVAAVAASSHHNAIAPQPLAPAAAAPQPAITTVYHVAPDGTKTLVSTTTTTTATPEGGGPPQQIVTTDDDRSVDASAVTGTDSYSAPSQTTTNYTGSTNPAAAADRWQRKRELAGRNQRCAAFSTRLKRLARVLQADGQQRRARDAARRETLQELASWIEDSPLEDKAAGDLLFRTGAYAEADAAAAAHSQQFEATIVEMAREWRACVDTQLAAEIKAARKIYSALDHYEDKVGGLRQKSARQPAGTEAAQTTLAKLERNQQKLQEAQEAYGECHDRLVRLDRTMEHDWMLVFPLVSQFIQRDMEESNDRASILSQLQGTLRELTSTVARHGLDPQLARESTTTGVWNHLFDNGGPSTESFVVPEEEFGAYGEEAIEDAVEETSSDDYEPPTVTPEAAVVDPATPPSSTPDVDSSNSSTADTNASSGSYHLDLLRQQQQQQQQQQGLDPDEGGGSLIMDTTKIIMDTTKPTGTTTTTTAATTTSSAHQQQQQQQQKQQYHRQQGLDPDEGGGSLIMDTTKIILDTTTTATTTTSAHQPQPQPIDNVTDALDEFLEQNNDRDGDDVLEAVQAMEEFLLDAAATHDELQEHGGGADDEIFVEPTEPEIECHVEDELDIVIDPAENPEPPAYTNHVEPQPLQQQAEIAHHVVADHDVVVVGPGGGEYRVDHAEPVAETEHHVEVDYDIVVEPEPAHIPSETTPPYHETAGYVSENVCAAAVVEEAELPPRRGGDPPEDPPDDGGSSDDDSSSAGVVQMTAEEERVALEHLVDMFPQNDRQDLVAALRQHGSAEAVAEMILLGSFGEP